MKGEYGLLAVNAVISEIEIHPLGEIDSLEAQFWVLGGYFGCEGDVEGLYVPAAEALNYQRF